MVEKMVAEKADLMVSQSVVSLVVMLAVVMVAWLVGEMVDVKAGRRVLKLVAHWVVLLVVRLA